MIRTARGDALKRAGSGRRWPLMIVGLIGLNVSIVAVTIVCATSDKSFGIEPDYYKKAVQWDRTARERGHASELGWDVNVSLADSRPGSALPVLHVELLKPADGGAQASTPLDGAQVQIEAFPQARSTQRVAGAAAGVGKGVYEMEADISRAGLWEVRIRVHRGPDAIAVTRTLTVPTSPGGSANP